MDGPTCLDFVCVEATMVLEENTLFSVLFMPLSGLCGYCIVKHPSTARFNFCPPKLSLKLVTFL